MDKKDKVLELHKIIQEILDYVCDICERNELTYFLVYGTALGAYRHKGFIPWDDDLDIAMPRDDYKKLINILHESKNDFYEIQDETNEQNYFLSFVKVRKKGTIFIESIAEEVYERNGIYVDIFPLDYVKNSQNIGFKIKRMYINYLKHILKFNSCRKLFKSKQGKIKYMFDLVLSCPGVFISKKKILKSLNKLMEGNVEPEKAEYIAQYDESSSSAVMPKNVYFPPRKIQFEGKLYFAPNKIEKYLEMQYGTDYMQLPPPEKRQTHEPIKLEF